MAERIHGAFINARYSTDNQNPDSIEVQVAKCTEWCHDHGLPILGVYADEATSGMKNSRPQYEAMMQQLRAGVADTVVIYDQSRMFRKMTAWFAFRDELSAIGVSVVSVTQPMIGKDLRDPTNFLTEGSMALFNQIWALQTRQKTMEKMRHMARNGQHTGGKPALGYMVVDGRLEICEEEAAIVRRIFDEYAGGKSYKQIIDGLNRDGIKTKHGNTFGTNSLYTILRNEKYIGTIVYGAMPYREDGTRNTNAKEGKDVIRIEDALPAIIDKDVFAKVQKSLVVNKTKQGGRPATKRDYPLRGKVFCADCKSAMTIHTSKVGYFYYRCTAQKRLHTCSGPSIRADVLEQTVADAVRQTLGQPSSADRLMGILQSQRSTIQDNAVATLERLIQEEQDVGRKLDNAVDAVLAGLSSPTVQRRITELEARKAEIEREKTRLRQTVNGSAVPEAQLRQLVSQITEGNDAASIAAILSIVSRVEVGADTITVWTILDPDPDGTYDWSEPGVILTHGTPSGVPIVFITSFAVRILVMRNKDTS